MSKLKNELGMSILFITHDLGLVKEFSDQVCVMKDGAIVEQGPTEKVFNNPEHGYTKKLLDAEPQPKQSIEIEHKPIIKVDNLNVFYNIPSSNIFKKNSFHAVKDISFEIFENTTIGLVGESGSGKSVSSLSLMRLVEFGGGEIAGGTLLFDRKQGAKMDLAKGNQSMMRSVRGNEIGMIFQEPMTALNPVFTVGRQLTEGLKLHKGLSQTQADARALELLKQVRIPEAERRLKQYPHELSAVCANAW